MACYLMTDSAIRTDYQKIGFTILRIRLWFGNSSTQKRSVRILHTNAPSELSWLNADVNAARNIIHVNPSKPSAAVGRTS